MSGMQQMVLSLTRWDGKAPREQGATESLLALLRMRGPGKASTARELADVTGVARRDVHSHLRWWVRKGVVVRAGTPALATYSIREEA